jgi:RecA/RadA recombinase
MAAKKKTVKAVKITEQITADDKLEMEMAALKLGDALKLVDDYSDIDVECISTGFPGLDACFGPTHFGLPRGQHSEIFAKKEHSGKTTSALQIGQFWQGLGLRVGVVDLEKATTREYYDLLKFQLDPATCPEGISALRIMRPTFDVIGNKRKDVSLEDVLDTVRKAANVFDLLIVDSVDALIDEAEYEKDAGSPGRVGGIGGYLRRFMRKNTNKRAHIIWVNHADVSTNSMPGMPPSYATRGGKSIPRYSFVRIELTVIEKLRANKDADPYGFVTRFQVVKNKMGSNWRYVDIPYIYGEAYSRRYDYFNHALKMGIIVKTGGWFSFTFPKETAPASSVYNGPLPGYVTPDDPVDITPEPIKIQGELNMYYQLRDNDRFFEAVKLLVDGEPIEADILPEEARGNEEEALGTGVDADEATVAGTLVL